MIEVVEYNSIAIAIALFLSLCAAIVLIGNAVKVITQIFKPKKDIEARLSKIEERLDHGEGCLDNDNSRIKDLESEDKLILRALIQLINHSVYGNHTDDMLKVRDDIETYLVNKS